MGASVKVEVIVDDTHGLYFAWGLGACGIGHVLSVRALGAALRLGWDEGIWNRDTESGSRWQRSGSFAVDERGLVRWVSVGEGPQEVPDFGEAVDILLGERKA
jgi:hypothetical protein